MEISFEVSSVFWNHTPRGRFWNHTPLRLRPRGVWFQKCPRGVWFQKTLLPSKDISIFHSWSVWYLLKYFLSFLYFNVVLCLIVSMFFLTLYCFTINNWAIWSYFYDPLLLNIFESLIFNKILLLIL